MGNAKARNSFLFVLCSRAEPFQVVVSWPRGMAPRTCVPSPYNLKFLKAVCRTCPREMQRVNLAERMGYFEKKSA
jgi:hypothetical protein